MIDDFHHKGQRQRMVEELRAAFRFDERVLDAMGRVPRHLFLDKGLEHFAYRMDKCLPIAAKQTMSQAFTVAMQTHLADVQKWDKVLEIGTGCGYQTAVLAELGARVYSVERQRELYEQAARTLRKLHYGDVSLYYGDGYAGKPMLAPFRKIIVTCGAPELPARLMQQLAIGGRMVVPVGGAQQTMMLAIRRSDAEFDVTSHGECRFVPMLEGVVELLNC
ncbi:MAG: protein-L-isoaspartate(D-aspartate) O-methyltransferase [Prevotellaceae bacterium]|jgi:protein-L-isoaspartate(D-aspartate) O-methyltransferase|nr:protein-L-isoaspartate(D-aspartate) O-methyltransferase [Prevotellaceae bacterium]